MKREQQAELGLSIAEAAELIGKSTAWVRRRVTNRTLDSIPSARGILVTAASLDALRQQIADRSRRHIRLVVNNS